MERWILRWKKFAELAAAAMFMVMFASFMASKRVGEGMNATTP